jgi:hypothetical protein
MSARSAAVRTATALAPAPGRPARTGSARTGSARTGSARTGSVRSVPARSVPQPELRLVPSTHGRRPRSRPSRDAHERRAPFALLLIAMLVGTSLALLFLNTAIAVDSLKATQLRAANAELAQDVQRLQQRVVSGGTPAALAAAASETGLVPSGAAAYLVVGPDGSSALRGIPVPAPEPVPAPATGSDGEQGGD